MDDKPLENRVGLPLKATPRWKSLLLAVPLSVGLLGYALPAASAEQREVAVMSKDVCGDKQVEMVGMEGRVQNTTSYAKFKDHKYGIELNLLPAKDSQQNQMFFYMIGPALCTLRMVKSAYLRAFGDKADDPDSVVKSIKVANITASLYELPTYSPIANGASFGISAFKNNIEYALGKKISYYTPPSWAVIMVHEAQHKEQRRKGLGNPSGEHTSPPMEFHATLYELLFMEQFPKSLLSPQDKINLNAHKEINHHYLLTQNAMNKWFDPSKSPKENICNFEINYLEPAKTDMKLLINKGFKRDPMCG